MPISEALRLSAFYAAHQATSISNFLAEHGLRKRRVRTCSVEAGCHGSRRRDGHGPALEVECWLVGPCELEIKPTRLRIRACIDAVASNIPKLANK